MSVKEWLQELIQWLQQNEILISVLTISSILTFIGTLIFIPWLILQLPADYFANSDSDHYHPLGDHPVAITVVDIVRNVLGACLVLIGFMLLVLPGQGLLTIILGVLVGRFPGKRRFVYWLVRRHGVARTINWIRDKGNRPPFELRQPSEN